MDLIDYMAQMPALKELQPQLAAGRHLLTGLNGSAKTVYLASLLRTSEQPLLVVENNRYHAAELVGDLSNLIGAEQVFDYPAEDVFAAEVAVSSPDALSERINTLMALTAGTKGIVVTSLAGLKRLVTPPVRWAQASLTFRVGERVDFESLAQQLITLGYRRDTLVGAPGDFALRGGILDVYPLNVDNPLRIELFDDEIDSVRTFDMATQRSLENRELAVVPPATDWLADQEQLRSAGERLSAAIADARRKSAPDAAPGLENAVAEQLLEGSRPEKLTLYSQYLYPEAPTLLDYLPTDSLVVFDDYSQLLDADVTTEQETAAYLTDLQAAGTVPSIQTPAKIGEIERGDKRPHLLLSLFQKGIGNLKLSSLTNVNTRTVPQFFSQLPLLKSEVTRWRKQNATVVLMTGSQAQTEKLEQNLRDFEIPAVLATPDDLVKNAVQVVSGQLRDGFELPDAHLVVVTPRELFNQKARRKPRHQTLANAERLKSYTDLAVGDFVVHVNHGIGRYMGMQTLVVDGVHQDYITIEYQKGDSLFIPVTQLNLVQKYVAADGKTPHINKLSGSEWQKTKRKVQNRIEDIADDLIALYAAREAEPGFAFAPDDELQAQFEADFAYPETADQLRSVREIKRDMEKPRPMDRLLVGDVGFGKTEVALRAAFKAVTNNKQVAMLVPTTILAQQHYDTMIDRFADYPVTVGILSRFQTAKQQKETLKGLKNGEIDVVVGTHRLLSQDVAFHDLGLLIVDEEQRFGVKHKERIKTLKQNVDVLTLTATPIPRTLNLSMLGVRDLSVIETPPTNRYPIQTFVMEENSGVIRSAIEREMERGGQTFFLHNRVQDIERTVDWLEQLVPDATVAYAHGQMTETQLENVIYDFLQGRYDVLVTTTIIETGVDMPNVNTLIVEDADHYGLSQLYQLRGRIGRSSRVAYAYLMTRVNRVLTEEAEKRLQAIRDFTELGAGFKIAMRDLSIRGAGNLLGSQQHGFIDAVGYDLYTQMLQEAVAARLGHKQVKRTDATVNLELEAYLPSDYIEDPMQKIEFYKRIREATTTEQENELEDDLIDRFGEFPDTVAQLLTVARLKRLADRAQILSIIQTGRLVRLTLSANAGAELAGEKLFSVLQSTTLKARVVTSEDNLVIEFNLNQLPTAQWLNELTTFVGAVAAALAPPQESHDE